MFCLSPGMGQGLIFKDANKLIENQIIEETDIGTQSDQSFDIIGEFKEGATAVYFKNQNQKPVVKFIRGGEIISQDPPLELSDLLVENIDACKINEEALLMVFSGKTSQQSDLNIYASVVDIEGNVIHKDILIADYNNTDQDYPKCISTEYNNLLFLVWHSYGQDEANTLGIYGVNLLINENLDQPQTVGSVFQVNHYNIQGDQGYPNLHLLQHKDHLSVEPRRIVVSYQGIGNFYDYLNKVSVTYEEFQQYPFNEGQIENGKENTKAFFRIFEFQVDQYLGLDEEYTGRSSFVLEDSVGLQNFSNVKICDNPNQDLIFLYYISDIQGLIIDQFQVFFQNDGEIDIQQSSKIGHSANNQKPMILVDDEKLFVLSLKDDGNGVLQPQSIPLIFNYDVILSAVEGWTKISDLSSITKTSMAFTKSSFSRNIGLILLTDQNHLLYSEYYYEELVSCTDTDCDVCFNNDQNQEQCLICKGSDPFWRSVRKTEDNQCTCSTGYIDNASLDCEAVCEFPCDTCFLSPSDCLSCQTGFANRSETIPCLCNNGFYDDQQGTCQQCVFPCDFCTSESQCTTCVVQVNRMTEHPCTCMDGHYEDQNNDCIQCSGLCENCISDTQCLSCKDENRVVSVTQVCVCNDEHYENESQECVQCEHPCKTCQNKEQCKSCILENSILVDGQCICQPGYYYDDIQKNCIICSQNCKTCSNDDSCDSCVDSYPQRQIENNCQCIEGYTDDEKSTGCVIINVDQSFDVVNPNNVCNERCKQCDNSSQKCTLCIESNPARDLNNFCQCIVGYKEGSDGISCVKEVLSIENPSENQNGDKDGNGNEDEDDENEERKRHMMLALIILVTFITITCIVYQICVCYLKKRKQQPIAQHKDSDEIKNQIPIEQLEQSMNKSNFNNVNNTHTNLLVQQTAVGETLKTDLEGGITIQTKQQNIQEDNQNQDNEEQEDNKEEEGNQNKRRNKRRNIQGTTSTFHQDYNVTSTEYQYPQFEQSQSNFQGEQQTYYQNQLDNNLQQQQDNENGQMQISFRDQNQENELNDQEQQMIQEQDGSNQNNEDQENNNQNEEDHEINSEENQNNNEQDKEDNNNNENQEEENDQNQDEENEKNQEEENEKNQEEENDNNQEEENYNDNNQEEENDENQDEENDQEQQNQQEDQENEEQQNQDQNYDNQDQNQELQDNDEQQQDDQNFEQQEQNNNDEEQEQEEDNQEDQQENNEEQEEDNQEDQQENNEEQENDDQCDI